MVAKVTAVRPPHVLVGGDLQALPAQVVRQVRPHRRHTLLDEGVVGLDANAQGEGPIEAVGHAPPVPPQAAARPPAVPVVEETRRDQVKIVLGVAVKDSGSQQA